LSQKVSLFDSNFQKDFKDVVVLNTEWPTNTEYSHQKFGTNLHIRVLDIVSKVIHGPNQIYLNYTLYIIGAIWVSAL